jgi:hypothetical protein
MSIAFGVGILLNRRASSESREQGKRILFGFNPIMSLTETLLAKRVTRKCGMSQSE